MKEYIIEAYMESNTGSAAMGRTVAELIRCKDCKYWNGAGKFCDYEMSGLEEDYCSWAEPKDTTEEVRKQLKDMEQRREMDRKK